MGKGLWERAWVRHVAVAVAYGLAAAILRELSVSYWAVANGLRLSVFLLAPYRYWPALLVGDLGYYAYLSYDCLDDWGMTWAIYNLLSPGMFIAPLIYWVRKRWQPSGNATHIGLLLCCTLLLACTIAIRGVLSVNLMHLPKGYVVHNGDLAAGYFIGAYLGTLTIAPLVLAIYQAISQCGWRFIYNKVADSRLVFESICLVLPLLAFFLWLGMSAQANSETRQLVQVAMFLPVVWLALRHGWQGAAIGGAIASCAIKLLMPALYDQHTIQAEILVAFAISTMLLMGSRIATLDRRAEQERADVRMALALAQRNLYIGELQLRMASQSLEQIRETVQGGFSMILGRLRHLQPAVDDRGYQRYALVAQRQLDTLADSLYPVAIREKGLPSALREGSLVQLLRDAGMFYTCDIRGPLSRLSHTLHMTVYRIVCEAIADACSKKDMSDIRVKIRCMERNARRGVVIRIFMKADPIHMSHVHWGELHAHVTRTTSGLGLRTIRDRAAVFEGRAKSRTLRGGRVISALLMDPATGGD
jgi:glucose-6-phosphate-specific signal transduction histidine kinase